MDLIFAVATVALLGLSVLALIMVGRRTRQTQADDPCDGVGSNPRPPGWDETDPAPDAEHDVQDAAPTGPDTAPGLAAPASRLARIRAAHGEDSSPARPPAPQPAPSFSDAAETVTAVLRRQVPVRDEPARSWLGGLPMMPESVEWPRGVDDQYPERGAIPLHFLAQIACEDLPPELWGGRGPRSGWLLFFINPNHFSGEDGNLHRVLHIAQEGPERRPPADCGPVHDKVYTGGSYNWLAAAAVPPIWRRWPVDIIAMPNALTLHEDDGSHWKTASPDNLSDLLYADVPLSGADCAGAMPRLRPLTFGQARAGVEALGQSLRYKVREPVDPEARALLLAEGGMAGLIASLEEGRERLSSMPPESLEQGQQHRLAFLEAALEEFAAVDAASLLETIETRHADWLVWREKIAKGCDQIAAMLGRSDPEALLSDDHWQQLEATFADKHFDHLELRHLHYRTEGLPIALMSPREIIEIKPPKGLDQVAIEYYLDPARRDRLPEGYAATQEPAWRTLYNNRPHRMGGYHDGLQSEPIEDAGFGKMLLMQIATDDAMDWCWGDAGAYYFWIRPEDLDRHDFSKVEVWLECH